MGEGFLVVEGRGGVRGLGGVCEEEGEDFLVECCWGEMLVVEGREARGWRTVDESETEEFYAGCDFLDMFEDGAEDF